MIQHYSPISGIDVYQDRYVATAGYDNQVILWDLKTKTALHRGYHDHLANHCKFSTCGQYLVTAGSDYLGRLWEVPSMHLLAVFTHHKDDVERIAISSDNHLIATACRDNHVRLFDFEGNLLETFAGHEADVISVAFKLEDNEIISSGDDGTIRVWDIKSGKQKRELRFGAIETDTICIKDGVIYAGNDEGKIVLIDNYEVQHTISAHQAGIKNITVHPGCNLIMSCSYDYSVKLWTPNPTTGLDLIEAIQCPLIVWLRASVIVNENLLAFGTFGDSFCTYDRAAGKWDTAHVQPTFGNNAVNVIGGEAYTIGDAGVVYSGSTEVSRVGSLCNFLTPFEDHMLTGGQAGIIFDALSGERIYQHHSPLNCGTTFNLNNRKFALIGTYTGEGILIEKKGGHLDIVTTIKLHDNAIKGVAANNRQLFSVCATGSCAFHALTNFSLLMRVSEAHFKIANGASVLRDGRFVSVSRDLKLRIWDNLSFQAKLIDTPHTHSIKCVVSGGENGLLIATGAYNGMIAIYDTIREDFVWVSRPTTSGISSLCYNEVSKEFHFSSYDGQVYTVDTASLTSHYNVVAV